MLRSRIQTCRTSAGLFGLATRSVLHRLYRSPGHQVDGGFMVDIFVVRSATRSLRLYGRPRWREQPLHRM